MPLSKLAPSGLLFSLLMAVLLIYTCRSVDQDGHSHSPLTSNADLIVKADSTGETIRIYRLGQDVPLVTQHARADFRPYLHPISSPDGQASLTEYSPGHHTHQTGLYWGFTRVNGRDYFHHPEGDYWKKVSSSVIQDSGQSVLWQTVYHLLDESKKPILEETQIWTMREQNQKLFLELEWRGKALTDITIGEYDYGGLFLRMPWKEGIKGEVNNAARQRNSQAEGQRAQWVDVGMDIQGLDKQGHITIFDHPENQGYPQTWRVDNQLGIGPVRARMGDWSIAEGETEIIRHQILAYQGDYDEDIVGEAWASYSGKDGTYSTADLWNIARKEGLEAKFLTPEEAISHSTLMDGFQLNMWASEPMITQPMAFCWDDKGRLWVAENRDYESRKEGFSNFGNSRILIIEDTDKDGVADSKKVFLEGIPFPAGIAVGFDGLFLGAPPNLLFVPDKNQDDVAEMEDIEVRLTGWGIRDRHETLNSFHWGPDGWLYGCEGFATPSKIRKPTGKGKLYGHKEPFPDDLLDAKGVDINGGVWRYHPTKDRFEVVAHGFSNPWGIDYDAKGQLFITACAIPHAFHVIPGGLYHRQGGQHFNPYAYTDIRTIVDHRHRSAHGGARVYLSDAFPQEHQGRLFMANIHEHAVLSDVLQPAGSGFVAEHGDEVMMANNAQWIGFSMELGPDGALYVLDWHDGDICGNDVLNKETGRIFRLTHQDGQPSEWEGRYGDLNALSDAQLVQLQTSASSWHARRARLILQERTHAGSLAASTHGQLRDLLTNETNADARLQVLWTLHITEGLSEQDLQEILTDQDEHLRAWAIQFLCEDGMPSSAILKAFEGLARTDPSARVRLYLASALQRMDPAARWPIAEALMQHGEDADDHNLPKMIWFGMEELVAKNPQRALAMASESKIPMLTELIARRAVDADATEALIAEIGKTSKSTVALLTGMRAGLEGRSQVSAPSNWEATYRSLQSDASTKTLALEIARQFGDAEAAKTYLAAVQNQALSTEERSQAIAGLAGQHEEGLIGLLPDLLKAPSLRMAAIRAIAAYQDADLGYALMKGYSGFNQEEKTAAIQTLSSRPKFGWMLTEALKDGHIEKRDVPIYVARQLRRVVGNGFVEVWGPIDQLASDDAAEYAKYKTLITDAAVAQANLRNGKTMFQRSCAACHTLYGEGGNIGPELTGSNRADLDYLLSNVLDPSGDISDDYKMVVITTRDGRTYSGNIASETPRQLMLKTVAQDSVMISVSEIQSREATEISLMPKGLLGTMTDQEVLDLVGYLRTEEAL